MGKGVWEACVHCCDSHLCSSTGVFDTLAGASLTQPHPQRQTHPQISRNTPRCPSVVLWPPCSGVEWGAFEPAITVRGSGTREQPANLAVEGSEESLSTLSDYTPTVRPPPKRC